MYEQRTPTMISPNPKQRVNVYRNLQKKMWSVRQGGRVIFHCNRIILKDVKFFVQAAGRARVLWERAPGIWLPLSGSTGVIHIPPRPFIQKTFNSTKLKKAIRNWWIM